MAEPWSGGEEAKPRPIKIGGTAVSSNGHDGQAKT
jgi:hypothetical protein